MVNRPSSEVIPIWEVLMRRRKLIALVLAALTALAVAAPAFADAPQCPPGLERHGNRCEAPGSGQETGVSPEH